MACCHQSHITWNVCWLQASPIAESSDPLMQFAQRVIAMTKARVSKSGIQSLEHSVTFWPRELSQHRVHIFDADLQHMISTA